jgi:hypothetical protein
MLVAQEGTLAYDRSSIAGVALDPARRNVRRVSQSRKERRPDGSCDLLPLLILVSTGLFLALAWRGFLDYMNWIGEIALSRSATPNQSERESSPLASG